MHGNALCFICTVLNMFEPSHFPPLGQTKRRAGNRCQVFQGEGRRAGLDRCYN